MRLRKLRATGVLGESATSFRRLTGNREQQEVRKESQRLRATGGSREFRETGIPGGTRRLVSPGDGVRVHATEAASEP